MTGQDQGRWSPGLREKLADDPPQGAVHVAVFRANLPTPSCVVALHGEVRLQVTIELAPSPLSRLGSAGFQARAILHRGTAIIVSLEGLAAGADVRELVWLFAAAAGVSILECEHLLDAIDEMLGEPTPSARDFEAALARPHRERASIDELAETKGGEP